MPTIAEIVDRLPNTFVVKKDVRGLLESAGIVIDQHGQAVGEFNRQLAARREQDIAATTAALKDKRERDAADEENRRQFENAGRDAEIALLASVQPHWPTYHLMLALCRDLAELFAAERGRDMGDVMAFKHALVAVPALLNEMGVDPDTFAGGIWETICRTRRISAAQSKAMAVAAAKHATLTHKRS